jgi:signal transduction histidine kinase
VSAILAIFAAAHIVLDPATRSERVQGIWMAQKLLDASDDPDRLQREVAAIRDRMSIRVTLFASDGRILASSASSPPGPLSPDTLGRATKEGPMALSATSFALASLQEGRPGAYAIVSWHGWMQPRAIFLIVFLVALGISSIPLARTIAKPLERLAKVTHDFGLGDLRARANTDRHDEIGDLARAFNQMADRVETLRRTEKELLANVSHELRTPLARIRVVLELACEEDAPVAKRYLTEITDDLNEIEQLLGDIITAAQLDLANERSENPYPPLRPVPVPLRPLLEAMARRFAEQHDGRAVECKIEDELTVSVDRVMLKHALANLLDNAHKYSPAGRSIELRVARDGREAVLVVKDHGQGVDAEDLAQVFTPFFRADQSRARGTGGVGLGLTLAQRIVEAHEGTIRMESRIGEGTAVIIRLPVLDASREEAADGDRIVPSRG